MKHNRQSLGQHKCSILIKEDVIQKTNSLWMMGDPFLRAYYSIYDMKKERIGLVGVAQTLRTPILDEEDIENMRKNERMNENEYILPEDVDDVLLEVEDHVKVVAEALGLDPQNEDHL